VHDSVFSCVATMPGAVPHTSTYALTNATLPYVLAWRTWAGEAALAADPATARGLSTHRGALPSLEVAHDLGLPTPNRVPCSRSDTLPVCALRE
jgi:alanine dehydrogenase